MFNNCVSIASQSEIIELDKNNLLENYAIISFKDKIESSWDGLKKYQFIETDFEDISIHQLEKPYEEYLPEAYEIALFIKKQISAGKKILCKCSCGESRSAGCAMAILEYFYKDGKQIIMSKQYKPNFIVYSKIMVALSKVYMPYVYK